MTKEQRNDLTEKISAALSKMTDGQSNRGSVATIGGHEIARRLLYAGGSQWCGAGRDWDTTESVWGWVVDGEYRLTAPKMFGFDGHNQIERRTPYYLQDGYDPQTTPGHDGRDPLEPVPNGVLLEIGRGLVEAVRKAQEAMAAESAQAAEIISALDAH